MNARQYMGKKAGGICLPTSKCSMFANEVTILDLVEYWSIQQTLLLEETHKQGLPSWPNSVLRSPVSLNSQQGTE